MKWKHFLSLGLCSMLAAPVSAENLYVFVPTDVRSKVMA